MGKIQEYASLTVAADGDLLFIGDTSTSWQINNISVANLHKVKQVWALDANGLKLTDQASSDTLGIFIKDGGNVGIGQSATSPNTFLELNSGARTDTFDAADSTTWTNMLLLNPTDTSAAAVGINFQVDGTFVSTGGAGIAGVKSHASAAQMDLVFITDPNAASSAERMRILHNGNVGIGSSSPGDLLEVSGKSTSTAPIFIRINFNTGSGDAASYGALKFTEDGAAKAYITYMGSNFTTAGRRQTLELRSNATDSTGGIAFFPSNSGDADVFFRGDGKVGIGDNKWSVTALPQAALHVKGTGVVADGDEPLLRVEATSGNAAIYLKNSGSAQPGYIVSSYNNLFIGASVVPGASTHLQISKSAGRLIVGGPYADYTYPLTVGTISPHLVEVDGVMVPATGSGLKPTVARFIGYNATEHGTIDGKTFLVLTNPVAQPQLGIVYQSAGSTGEVQWLSGSFYGPDDVNYFGWRYLGAANINDPDRATFYSTVLENNTVYISSANTVSADIAECTGGINAANTPVGYGRVKGRGTTLSPLGAAQYNVSAMEADPGTIPGTNKNIVKITFTKELSNAKYTLIATGWDQTNGQVITGLIGGIAGSATHWNAAHCYITFYPTDVDLEDTDTLWSWAIYGAKFKE